MPTQITPEHILDYADAEDFSQISDEMVYEAFCEQVVNQNPEYTIETLQEEWENESTCSKQEFTEAKFNRVVSDHLKSYLTLEHKETWIEDTARGIQELAALND